MPQGADSSAAIGSDEHSTPYRLDLVRVGRVLDIIAAAECGLAPGRPQVRCPGADPHGRKGARATPHPDLAGEAN